MFSTIWQRKWMIALVAMLFTGMAVVILQRMTPIYTAETQVMLTRTTNVLDFESVVSGLPVDAKIIEGEIAIITSNQLLDRVVEQLRLERDPEFNSTLRPRPFHREWIKSIKSRLPADLRLALGMSDEAKVVDPVLQRESERLSVINSLGRSLNARQHGLSVVIAIRIESTDSRKSALIANAVADQYLVDQLEAKYEGTKRATAWLSERVEDLRAGVGEAEAAVVAYRERLTLGSGQGVAITNQQLGEINSQLVSARAEVAQSQARYGQVKRRIDEGGFSAAANVLSSPLILTFRQQRAELARRAAELATRYGERHPSMLNIRAEIRDVGGSISVEVRKIVEGLKNDVEVAEARVNALADSLVQLESKAIDQSKTSLALIQLERESQASRLIYENFLNRFKETSEQQGLQEADARVISRAQPPKSPTKPKKSLLTLISGFFGIAVGMGLAFFLEAINNTFRNAKVLEEYTGVPVLANLPMIGRGRKRQQLLTYLDQKPSSALAESIRNLRTALFLANIDSPPKTVMLTSALANEGKSTTCIMLAQLSVQIGKTAVIVDCDIRRPTLHKTFAIKDGPDIISVLEGSASLDEALRTDELSGVSLLPAIQSTPQAVDILSSKRFGMMIDRLREKFDLVLLDAPPILLVSDAGVVGKYADATICVVRWDLTPREATVQAVKQLREYGMRVSGAVLTMIDRNRADSYAHGRSEYGYYGGKNAYYND
jgi:capsular exopolysaccharide synthesis family protein